MQPASFMLILLTPTDHIYTTNIKLKVQTNKVQLSKYDGRRANNKGTDCLIPATQNY